LFVVRRQPRFREGGVVRAQLVGRDPGGSETLFLEQLPHELASRGLVPAALDQDLQHLARIVDA
jgi:hypothetical protein